MKATSRPIPGASRRSAPGFSLRRPALFRALYTYITRNFPLRMVLAAARSAAYWRLLGPSHPVKRHDVPSVHTLARRQPAMSLLPLGIRREHLRREHRRPLRAVPVERLTQLSRMWSGEQALHDRSARDRGHRRTNAPRTSRSLGRSSPAGR